MFNIKEILVKVVGFILEFKYKSDIQYFDGKFNTLSLVQKNTLMLAQDLYTFLLPPGIEVNVKYTNITDPSIVTKVTFDMSET